jgi:hypothetical protein
MKELHCLSVQQRIKFQIASLIFKTFHFSQPSYLADLFIPRLRYSPSIASFHSRLETFFPALKHCLPFRLILHIYDFCPE